MGGGAGLASGLADGKRGPIRAALQCGALANQRVQSGAVQKQHSLDRNPGTAGAVARGVWTTNDREL